MANDKATPPHRWRFYRAGGVDQVRLDRGADLIHLDQLDQKLWVALSCPVKGLEFDEKTLALLDSDHDGRVRVPELLAALKWIRKVLKDPELLVAGGDSVALDAIDGATAEGATVLAAAKLLLKTLGKEAAGKVTLADAQQTAELFAKSTWNGDGIVPPDSIGDAAARAAAADVVACTGGAPDRSGKQGFGAAHVDAFFAECAVFDAWHQQAERDAKAVMPLGAATLAAAAAVAAVRTKVEDYFGRCRLVAYDARALAALDGHESAYLALAAKDLTITAQEVAGLPLATIAPGKALPLAGALNPAWVAALARFRDDAVAPLLGERKGELTEADWSALQAKLAAHHAWIAAKKGAKVEALGLARVRELLAGKSRELLAQAIAADLAAAPEVDAIAQVERLTRLKRDLHPLLNNFASFTDFYARRKAIFQSGTLYFDGRSCDLCVQVTDPAKHAAQAALSRSYLAYVDCTRPGGEKMLVAAAFTAGSDEQLFVGRNGLFYDRRGRDWDATIARIVGAPISIGQAFWSPYRKLMRFIEEFVTKRAAAADSSANATLQASAAGTGAAAPRPKIDVGTVAAMGVAVGGITAALAAIFSTLSEMDAWKYPVVAACVMLAISGPSMVIAWIKLRQRNLGPLLDANGWAVNALTRINMPLGDSLTDVALIPAGSERSFSDPYAPRKSPWPKVIVALLLFAAVGWGLYRANLLHRWLPWIPPHHVEESVASGLVPSAMSGAPGASIEITVPSAATALHVAVDGVEVAPLPVAGGKATLVLPVDAKPGSRVVVTDATVTGSQCTIDVVAAGN